MIPSDVASRLQLTADAAVARAPTTQQVSDALADLVPGQRVLAEIQVLLPTGAYRALINQRDVTLALPFSAKAGDSLEMEVVENEGRLALAVVAHRSQGADTPAAERPAVETTLSRTGNFIAGLLGRNEDGETAKPAPLNANQPIAANAPLKAGELVPLLRQAIAQSGMFYESHQAQWVSHQLTTASLLTEPQGQLSPLATQQLQGMAAPDIKNQQNTPPAQTPTTDAAAEAAPLNRKEVEMPVAVQNTAPSDLARTATAAGPASSHIVATELVPLVQQQLEALANQTYVWQGQAWPGQPMRWEIEEDGRRNADGEPDEGTQWQTRLTLTMPELGEVRAAVRLSGGEIALTLSAEGDAAALKLTGGSDELRLQMEAAGLKVSGFTVGRHERTEG